MSSLLWFCSLNPIQIQCPSRNLFSFCCSSTKTSPYCNILRFIHRFILLVKCEHNIYWTVTFVAQICRLYCFSPHQWHLLLWYLYSSPIEIFSQQPPLDLAIVNSSFTAYLSKLLDWPVVCVWSSKALRSFIQLLTNPGFKNERFLRRRLVYMYCIYCSFRASIPFGLLDIYSIPYRKHFEKKTLLNCFSMDIT